MAAFDDCLLRRGGTLSSECTGIEGQAEAKADQDSLTQAEKRTHLCRNVRAQLAERRAHCALTNCSALLCQK